MPHPHKKRQPLLRPPQADNDPEVLHDRCPTCGQCYLDTRLATPFDPDLSAALDSLTIAAEAISHAKAVLEEVLL